MINISHRGEDQQNVQYRAIRQSIRSTYHTEVKTYKLFNTELAIRQSIRLMYHTGVIEQNVQYRTTKQFKKNDTSFGHQLGFFVFFYPLMEKGLNFKQSKNG